MASYLQPWTDARQTVCRPKLRVQMQGTEEMAGRGMSGKAVPTLCPLTCLHCSSFMDASRAPQCALRNWPAYYIIITIAGLQQQPPAPFLSVKHLDVNAFIPPPLKAPAQCARVPSSWQPAPGVSLTRQSQWHCHRYTSSPVSNDSGRPVNCRWVAVSDRSASRKPRQRHNQHDDGRHFHQKKSKKSQQNASTT